MRVVFDIRSHKIETRSTILATGGNLIDYPGDVSTPTSYLTTMKLHFNRAISDVKSRYMCMDVKDFYLNNMMDSAEYIMIQIAMVPREFLDKYNLQEKSHNGYTYARVTKGIYRLPQEEHISHDALVKHLDPYGSHPSSKTPGLWTHNSQSISFTFIVDNFGVKYLVK